MEALGSAATAGLIGYAGAKALGVDGGLRTFNLFSMSLQPSMAYGAQIAASSLAMELANQYLPAWKTCSGQTQFLGHWLLEVQVMQC